MIARLTFTAALALATVVQAQTPEKDRAAATAYADQLIADGEATAYFDNITTDATARVRHRASGMTCAFKSGVRGSSIRVFPSIGGATSPGDDVSCGFERGPTIVTTYATRYESRPSAEEVFQSAIGAIRRNSPDARPRQGLQITVPGSHETPPLIAAFDLDLGRGPALSLVMVSHIGDWSFKARATGPAGDPSVAPTAATAFAESLPARADRGTD
jgi:hypothetical protein